MNSFPHKRIVVIGTTSSGKSTLAEAMAKKIGGDFIELDALHWEPNWVEAPDDIFRQRVEQATQAEKWVVAGNYSKTRELVWSRAEAIIWLDYPFHVVFWRMLTRTVRRVVTREELWNGNRENLWTQLKLWSEESLIHWFFKTYWRRKREIPLLWAESQYKHLRIIQLKSPKAADGFLNEFVSQ